MAHIARRAYLFYDYYFLDAARPSTPSETAQRRRAEHDARGNCATRSAAWQRPLLTVAPLHLSIRITVRCMAMLGSGRHQSLGGVDLQPSRSHRPSAHAPLANQTKASKVSPGVVAPLWWGAVFDDAMRSVGQRSDRAADALPSCCTRDIAAKLLRRADAFRIFVYPLERSERLRRSKIWTRLLALQSDQAAMLRVDGFQNPGRFTTDEAIVRLMLRSARRTQDASSADFFFLPIAMTSIQRMLRKLNLRAPTMADIEAVLIEAMRELGGSAWDRRRGRHLFFQYACPTRACLERWPGQPAPCFKKWPVSTPLEPLAFQLRNGTIPLCIDSAFHTSSLDPRAVVLPYFVSHEAFRKGVEPKYLGTFVGSNLQYQRDEVIKGMRNEDPLRFPLLSGLNHKLLKSRNNAFNESALADLRSTSYFEIHPCGDICDRGAQYQTVAAGTVPVLFEQVSSGA